MSDKQVYFYQFEQIAQIKLQTRDHLKLLPLDQRDNTYFIGTQGTNNSTIISITEQNRNNYQAENLYSSIPGYPLFYDSNSNFMIFYSNNQKVCYLNTESKEQKVLDVNFRPKFAIPIPQLKATLFANKQKYMAVLLNDSFQVANPVTLQRILAPYSSISCMTHIDGIVAFSCYLQQLNQYHINVVALRPSAEGKQTFTLIDQIKMKPNKIVRKIQFIDQGNELLIVYNHSKFLQMTINKDGQDMKTFRRLELKAKHTFNLFKVKNMVLLSNRKDIMVQDSSGLYIFKMSKDQIAMNKLIDNSQGSETPQIVQFKDQIFLISKNQFDQQLLDISVIVKISSNQAIYYFLEEKQDIYTAQQLIRATGSGKKQYLEYKLQQQGYNNLDLLKEYLQGDFESSEPLVKILKTQKIGQIEAFEQILIKAVQQAIRITNDSHLKSLLFATARLSLYKNLNVTDIPLKAFVLEYPITQIISHLTNIQHEKQNSDIRQIISDIFKQLQLEVILNYNDCIQNLPLEFLDPQFLLKYLPPGHSKTVLKQSFWQNFINLIDNQQMEEFEYILTDWQVYHDVAKEYIYQINQPGKAIIILQEAAQHRQITNLTRIAIDAIEHTLISNIDIKKHDERISDLFGAKLTLNESLKAIEVTINTYFNNAKWIFTMDQHLYKRYQQDIKYFLVDIIGVDSSPMLQFILDHHGNNSLLFLRDEDLAKIVLDIIYDKMTTQNSEQVSDYFMKLQELTLSENQSRFIKVYLSHHSRMQTDILSNYEISVPYKELLKLQINNKNETCIDELQKIITTMIESEIKKSRKVKEQVLAFSSSGSNQKWINLLHSIVEFRDQMGYYNEQVDVYSIFITKILDNRVTQSIDQIIKSNIIPIDELQQSILKYLQDQYNHCLPENFYSFGSNSRNFLELLKTYDTSKKYIPRLNQELKLIETTFFLKQNDLLTQLPYHQIRQDFYQERMIDRILQVHGFNNYPDSFTILFEVQRIIDETQINQVVIKSLKHINSIKLLENEKTKPAYMEVMVTSSIINRKEENFQWVNEISDILFKISKITINLSFKKSLLVFMIKHINRQKELYYEVCKDLVNIMKKPQQNTLIDDLKYAISEDLKNKALRIIRKIQEQEQVNDKFQLFTKIVSQTYFSKDELKSLALLLELDIQIIQKLKTIKDVSTDELIDLLLNEQLYQSHIKPQQKNVNKNEIQISSVQSQEVKDIEGNFIQQLIDAQEKDDIMMILDMNYTDWNSQLDISKILSDFKKTNLRSLPIQVIQYIIEKLQDCQVNLPFEQLKTAVEMDLQINFLLIIEGMLKPQSQQEDLKSQVNKVFSGNQNLLLEDFQRIVTDTNLFQLSLCVDGINPQYTQLLSIALYLNKLSLFLKNYPYFQKEFDIENYFYQFIEKDIVQELIGDNKIISQINQEFRLTLKNKYQKEINEEQIKSLMINI